jgi:hypothetical protein
MTFVTEMDDYMYEEQRAADAALRQEKIDTFFRLGYSSELFAEQALAAYVDHRTAEADVASAATELRRLHGSFGQHRPLEDIRTEQDEAMARSQSHLAEAAVFASLSGAAKIVTDARKHAADAN